MATESTLPFDLPLWAAESLPKFRLRIKSRGLVQRRLVSRAMRDPEFYKEFSASPKTFAEAELGTPLPSHIQVDLLNETERERYIVIPQNPRANTPDPTRWPLEEIADWVLQDWKMSLLDEAVARALLVRVWADETYKQQFIADPVSTLNLEWGMSIDNSMNIRVAVETQDQIYIVVPPLLGYHDADYDCATFDSLINQSVVVGSTTYPCNTL